MDLLFTVSALNLDQKFYHEVNNTDELGVLTTKDYLNVLATIIYRLGRTYRNQSNHSHILFLDAEPGIPEYDEHKNEPLTRYHADVFIPIIGNSNFCSNEIQQRLEGYNVRL